MVHTYHGHVLEGYFSPLKTALFIALERVLARVTRSHRRHLAAIERELRDSFRIGRAAHTAWSRSASTSAPLPRIDDAARAAARRARVCRRTRAVVTTVGRLTAIKQHRLFLDRSPRLAPRGRGVLALIAGDGELRTTSKRMRRKLGIADRVRFLGWRRDLAVIYGATDVFVLTSRNEGTPVALIEAMASGVPGVSTDVGGVKDVIVSPDVGARVPDGDVAGLAAHIVRYLADPDLRRRTGQRARAGVLDRYSLDRLVRDIVALYSELLADAKKAAPRH